MAPNRARIAGSFRLDDRLVVRAILVLPCEELGSPSFGGRITRPEALEPGDQVRLTASAALHKADRGRSWSYQPDLGAQP